MRQTSKNKRAGKNVPLYLNALSQGTLRKKAEEALRMLSSCMICPRKCGVNRLENQAGFCRIGRTAKVYTHILHHGEEPPISGERGSGTIFFSGCNMRCAYCQNYQFSQEEEGKEVSAEGLADIMLNLQAQGSHNINLVTPTHVMPQILEALLIAAGKGLEIPLVYNTSGYELPASIQFLAGLIDIYLVDMRYASEEAAVKYSAAPGYPGLNQASVAAMHSQVGIPRFNAEGIMEQGLIIRHLVLPMGMSGTQEIMQFIAGKISKETYISLMSQYVPCHKAMCHKELCRRITREEYTRAQEAMEDAGLSNGWTQEGHGLETLAGYNLKIRGRT